MDVKEIVQKKENLEKEILEKIAAFEKECGIYVDDIHAVIFDMPTTLRKSICKIKVSIKLESANLLKS